LWSLKSSRCFGPWSPFLLVCFPNCFYCLPFEDLEAEKEEEEDDKEEDEEEEFVVFGEIMLRLGAELKAVVRFMFNGSVSVLKKRFK
jgi:hypothetical protein